jgi:hypothetical protein
MVMRYCLSLAIAATLTCGCAGTAGNRPLDTTSFVLNAGSRNAGDTGKGFLTAQGDKTLVNLTLSSVPPWMSRPVQIFTFVYAGSCARLGAYPAYALNNIVEVNPQSGSDVSGPVTLSKTVPVPLDTIRSGAYAIVLRAGPADGNWDIFCGDMQ